ncbi:hypothetical protein [Nocardia sp. NPDC004722]
MKTTAIAPANPLRMRRMRFRLARTTGETAERRQTGVTGGVRSRTAAAKKALTPNKRLSASGRS